MTSVGYGDVVPSTKYGRATMAVVALWGVFLMSLIVAVLSNILFLKKKDKSVIDQYKERCFAARIV